MVVRNDDIIYISDNNTTELGNIDTGIRGRDQCNDNIVLRRAFSQHIVERLGREMQAMTVSATTTYDETTNSTTELDSHADSPVVGKNCVVLEESGKTAKVSGFTSKLGEPLSVPVVTAAVAYDCEYSGETYIMVIHNALYFREMEVNLIPPLMMRLAGVELNECPKFLSNNPSIEDHSVYFPEAELRIALQFENTASCIPTRKPTGSELKKKEGEYLLLTPNTPYWNPHTEDFKLQEMDMVDYNGFIKERKSKTHLIESVLQLVASNIERSSVNKTTDSTQFVNAVELLDEVVSGINIDSVYSGTRKKRLNAKIIARRLNIPYEMAKRTLRSTTQLGVRVYDDPTLTRKYRTNDRLLRYTRLLYDSFMDTMFSAVRSIRHFKTCQVFATEFGHVFPVPMEDKSGDNIAKAIKRYFKEHGVPIKLICDQASEQVKGTARVLCHDAGCTIYQLEKGTPASNRAERAIKTLKDGSRDDMFQTNSPLSLWCYCVERRGKIINSTVRGNPLLQNSTPHTKLSGQPTDISALCEFGWYDWVIYRIEGQSYPYTHKKLGRVLGPADNAGSVMSQWVLAKTGDVMPIQTLRHLTPAELNNPTIQERMKEFTAAITKKLGDSATVPKPDNNEEEDEVDDPDLYVEYQDHFEDEVIKTPEMDDIGHDPALLKDAEVILPHRDNLEAATVIGRSKDGEGKYIGTYDKNPIVDTTVYDVMFEDGTVSQYSANIIAESIYSQVDEEGFRYQVLDHISDHRVDKTALKTSEAWVTARNGRRSRKMTTKGWYFKAEWKDGTSTWVPLKDIKEDSPVQVAEYAHTNEIIHEPALAWWAPHILKHRDRVIAKVKSRSKKKTHKYGIQIPRNVREAYELDTANKNTYWADAISAEMTENRVAFDILEQDQKVEPGRKYLECYMIFEVKMDFRRKARFVANGAKTPDLTTTNFAGVVSRDTVRIALTYAALNGLEVMSSDILNAYLQAPISEKYWTICGPEFGPELEGCKAHIVRALYGCKSAGRDFRNHLRECMEMLGYSPCLADPDLWMREAVHSDGSEYYEYVLLYVDDTLCISEYPKEALLQIDKYFPMKRGSIGPPDIYLGGKVKKIQLPNGVEAWSLSMSQYVEAAINNLEKNIKSIGMKLPSHTKLPMDKSFEAALDKSEFLDDEMSNYYQSLIGVLRWIVEMGRMDITTEVSILSSYVASPRMGHFQELLRIFAYLKIHHNARVVFDPTYPVIDEAFNIKQDWSDFYGNAGEECPANAPSPKGKEFMMRGYVDASFGDCKLTRKSRTGFIVFLNSSPIYYYSKKQGSCEISTFGSEFVAMKQCCEYVKGLRYKLRMMGIPVSNPTFIHGDNRSVLWNTTVPESTLKRKSSSVAYHFVREGVSKDMWRTAYVKTSENVADIFTKIVSSIKDRKRKIRMLLYDIYPE